jgi:soluble lytic murein transglycosylase-like protein
MAVRLPCFFVLAATVLAQQATDPRIAMRAAMDASIARQRESVQKQMHALEPQASQRAAESGWYTTPWPRTQGWIQPIAPVAPLPEPANATAPPVVTRSSFSMPCLPLPSATLSPMIEDAADRQGFAPDLLRAVIRKESAGYPCAVSNKGALGLMQLMPATAAMLGVNDPLDPSQNLDGGARFLGQLLSRYQGNLSLALAAYNAGPGAVDKAGGVPPYPETKNYIRDIIGALGAGQ